MKKALFTVHLGGYDNEPIPHKFEGWDNVIFTDTNLKINGWHKVVRVKPTDKPDIESRRYKWLSHLHIPEYDMVCYYDANMRIRTGCLPDHPFRVIHRLRTTVLEEVEACNKQVHRCTVESLNEEYDFFRNEGFPDDQGLFQNGFFCREHNEKENKLCEYVFELLEQFTPRDQVALPFAMWKLGHVQESLMESETYLKAIRLKNHRIIKPRLHGLENNKIDNKIPGKPVVVHHITPGRSDKNFGKSINDIVKGLPDNDWICLRDIDTIPMYHEVFFEQCEQIANSGKFDLVGCMTNRLGLVHQLYNGVKSDESDIMTHREIALELYERYGSDTFAVDTTIGGLFMLFSKKTWEKAGGFPEGGIQVNGSFIDYHFCKRVLGKKLKIGLAKGIYLFHYYRLHHGDQTRSKESKKHLFNTNHKIKTVKT